MQNNKENIQNIIIGILSVLVVLGIAFFVSSLNGEKNAFAKPVFKDEIPNYENETYDEKTMKEYINIDINSYFNLKKEDHLNIIYVARPGCGYCVKQDPILKHVAFLYNLKINYLNIDTFSDKDNQKFINSDERFKDGYGTPMILITKNNIIIDNTPGYTVKDDLIKFFKDNKIIIE